MTLFPGEKLAKMTKAIASRWQTLGWALEWALEHRTQLITYSEWCAKELDHADLFKKEWIVMFNWLNSPTMMFEASLVNDICQWFIHPEFAWSQSASWRKYSTGRAGCRLLEMPLRSFRRFHMIWIARTYFEQTALCYLHGADPSQVPIPALMTGHFDGSESWLQQIPDEVRPQKAGEAGEADPLLREKDRESGYRSRVGFLAGMVTDVLNEV